MAEVVTEVEELLRAGRELRTHRAQLAILVRLVEATASGVVPLSAARFLEWLR